MRCMINGSRVFGVGLSLVVGVMSGCMKESEQVLLSMRSVGSQNLTDRTVCTILHFENNLVAQKIQRNGFYVSGSSKAISIDTATFQLATDVSSISSIVAGSRTVYDLPLESIVPQGSDQAIYSYPTDSEGKLLSGNYFTADFNIKVLDLNTRNNGSPTGAHVTIYPELVYGEGACGRMYFYSITNSYLSNFYTDPTQLSGASVIPTYGRTAVDGDSSANSGPNDTNKRANRLPLVAVYDATKDASTKFEQSLLLKKVLDVKKAVTSEMLEVIGQNKDKSFAEFVSDLPKSVPESYRLNQSLKNFCKIAKTSRDAVSLVSDSKEVLGALSAAAESVRSRTNNSTSRKAADKATDVAHSERASEVFSKLPQGAQASLITAFKHSACSQL